MPKQSQRSDVNNFVGGLVTEASVLNFPPNASADEQNFDLDRTGLRKRRLGMNYEPEFTNTLTGATTLNVASAGYNTFRWESVGGDPNVNYAVVQCDQILNFFDLSKTSVTKGGTDGSVSLTVFPVNTRYSFATVEGYLVVVAGAEQFAVISRDFVANTFATEYGRIQVRDVWGVEEKIDPRWENDVTFRSANIDPYHYYNLQNQSWGIPRETAAANQADPIFYYASGNGGLFPSTSEQVWTGLQFQAVATGQVPFERMYPNLYTESLGGKIEAAKGYYIIDALRRGTSRSDAAANNKVKYPICAGGTPSQVDRTDSGPKCTTDFAGRIWYSGFAGVVIGGDKRSPNLSNYVFFSQLIKSRTEFGKCYQDGDPTSRDNNDIVATDGGFVRISGARNIIALRNLHTHLIIIASNGVWTVTGGTQDSGFDATNYKVSRISTFGGLSESSVILAGDNCFYWSEDGIYAISKNQYGDMTCDSITLGTIQSYYDMIGATEKQRAFGEYDQISKKLRWIFKSGTAFTGTSTTTELIFDISLKAWTKNAIMNLSNNSVEVMGVFTTANFTHSITDDIVFAGVDNVLVNTDQVVIPDIDLKDTVQSLRYLAVNIVAGIPYFTVSFYNESTFVDWISKDGVGVDALAFCVTGDSTFGDSGVEKQTPYLIIHFNRTEDGVNADLTPAKQSSCLMRAQWSFANNVVSNKWSPLTQAYRYRKVRFSESAADTYDTGFEVITTKNKLRGRGKSLALYFQTEPGKDLQLLGWNLTLNGNQIT